MASYTIVIPAYNEEAAIGSVLMQLRGAAPDATILVVDDGSTDHTADIAAQHGARVIRHPVNRGYGRSVKTAVAAAETDIIAVTDADGTYPADRLHALLAVVEKGVDMAVGARMNVTAHESFFKSVARWFLRLIVQYASGMAIPDVNSGMRVFRKSGVLPYFSDICDGFSFTTTITLVYHLTHKTVVYIPIPYEKRIGTSKVKIAKDTLRTLQYITECIVRYNPLKAYLMLCILSVIVGCAFIPLVGPMGALFGLLGSLMLAGIGLIAESMRRARV